MSIHVRRYICPIAIGTFSIADLPLNPPWAELTVCCHEAARAIEKVNAAREKMLRAALRFAQRIADEGDPMYLRIDTCTARALELELE
jgi:hypothetical protein